MKTNDKIFKAIEEQFNAFTIECDDNKVTFKYEVDIEIYGIYKLGSGQLKYSEVNDYENELTCEINDELQEILMEKLTEYVDNLDGQDDRTYQEYNLYR
tara:strand:- start:1717 stop:2013 length:297 start_codon:yes stop_codon:yes gene_type:complete